MKWLGMILLVLGVGLTASFGSQLSPEYRGQLVVQGESHFATVLAAEAYAKYCEGREAASLAAADGCDQSPMPGLPDESGAETAKEDLKTDAQKRAWIDWMEGSTASEPASIQPLRGAWLKAEREAFLLEVAVAEAGLQDPVKRLQGWSGIAGLGFLGGLVLLVIGAVLSRIAAKQSLADDDEAKSSSEGEGASQGPVDFGDMLTDVHRQVCALRDEMRANEEPTVGDFNATQKKLEALQLGPIARLVAAGPRVQLRYGIKAFAMIYSPLSSGERRLNRVWATLVDRHWPEACASVEGAASDFEVTVAALREHSASKAS